MPGLEMIPRGKLRVPGGRGRVGMPHLGVVMGFRGREGPLGGCSLQVGEAGLPKVLLAPMGG